MRIVSILVACLWVTGVAQAADITWNFTTMTTPITYHPITGDDDSEIDSAKVYTHVVDFGSDATRALINGVQFQAGSATFGSIAGTAATVGTGTSTIPITHSGNGNANPYLNGAASCGMEDLVKDMFYNDTTAVISLTGLTPGQKYRFRLYNRAWGSSAGSRPQNIGFDTDGVGTDINGAEDTAEFDEDDATDPDPGFGTFSQVYALTYDYVLPVGVSTLTIYVDENGDDSYHIYGLSNEEAEVVPPTVATLLPADDATVATPTSLTVTFNTAITTNTIGNITITNITAGTADIILVGSSELAVSGAGLVISPTSPVIADHTDYAVLISTNAIKDLNGNFFAGITNDTTWNFTTTIPDITDPTLQTISPADDATNVSVSVNLVATFSDPVFAGAGSIIISNLTDGTAVTIAATDGQVSFSTTNLTIDLADALLYEKSYAVLIETNAVKDASDNFFAGFSSETIWNFTTFSANAQTTYTWTGATDGDWDDASNWDGNGVPVDNLAGTGNNAGLTINPGGSIVFDGGATPLPTSNIPDLGGFYPTSYDTPSVVIKQGGTLALTLGGSGGDVWSNQSGTRNVLTVGDGIGAAGEVTVSLGSIDSNADLARHDGSTVNNFQVNSDGILNVNIATVDFGYANGRNAKITIDGGEVNFSGVLSDISSYAARVIHFTATNGTFTANYGGDFADIAAVSNRLAFDFTSGAGIKVEATDNTTSFTVTSVAFFGPSVTVEVPDAAAAEQGSDPGTIRISRGSDTNADFDVYYTLGGSADGSDYTESHTGTATITDGNSFVDLVFTPVDDFDYEGNQTIQLTITPNVAYAVSAPSSGTITITDNEESTISSVADGNWTNAATWSSVVPDAQRTVSIQHDVTIDSAVDDINVLTGNGSGNLIMNGGTLDVINGGWNGLRNHHVSNGSSLRFNTYTRFVGTVTVDDSTLTFGSVADFRGGDVDMTIGNGSTFITPKIKFWDVRNHRITLDGSGNAVTNGTNETDGGAGTMTYRFVLDGTDAAMSTFNYTSLDLDYENYTWNLDVDATGWNGVITNFTLFDSATLTGRFDNVAIRGADGDIAYDYDNGTIGLSLTATALYWDNNGSNAGVGTAGGTWAVPTTNQWSDVATGAQAPIASTSTTTNSVLHFGSAAVGLAAGTVTVSGTVDVNSLNFGSASGTITLSGGTIALGGDTPFITVNNTSNTIRSFVSSAVGITKDGAGTLSLSATNDHTGDIMISTGTLRIGDVGQLGSGSYTGRVSIGSGATFDYSSSANQDLGGVVSGEGTLLKSGAGTLTLSGANTYAGTTMVSAGSLALSGGSAIPDGTGKSDVKVDGRLDMNGSSETINGLSGSGIVDNTGAAASILAIGADNGTSTFSGAVTGSVGTLTLNKIGAGTLTLSGEGNSPTSVNAAGGTLMLASNSTTAVSGDMRISNNAIPGGDNGALVVKDGASLTVDGSFLMGNRISKVGTAHQLGGTVAFNGTTLLGHWSNAQGHYTISNGTLNVLNNYLTLGNDGKGYLNVNGGTVNLKGVQMAWKANAAREGHIVLDGGTLNIASLGIRRDLDAYSVTLTRGTLGALDAWGSAANVNIALGGSGDGSSLDIDTSGGDITLSGMLSGAGGFTKVGTNTLVLAGPNTYIGDTVVEGGVLQLNTDASLNPSNAVHITGSGTIDVDAEVTVDSLWFDNVQQFVGTWGAPGGSARFQDVRFSGSSGFLKVKSGPATGLLLIVR